MFYTYVVIIIRHHAVIWFLSYYRIPPLFFLLFNAHIWFDITMNSQASIWMM